MKRIKAQLATFARAVKPRYKPIALATVCILGVGIVLYFWQVPLAQVRHIQSRSSVDEKLTPEEEVTFINDFRRSLIGSIGTVATIIGGIVLFLNFKIARERLDVDIHKINADKRLNESRLVSERFSKAIEQIGSENIHVRLGGIYSLEKIAIDSPDDHWTVIEVLTAFIREESPILDEDIDISSQSMLPTDIQAALTVICRQGDCDDNDERKIVRLFKVNLRLAGFNNAKLRGAQIRYSDLKYSSFSNADLSGANLYSSDLILAALNDAKLNDADLRLTDLAGAQFDGANLHNTNLISARNLTEDQISVGLLCKTKLPQYMANLDPNRDCDEIEELE